MAQPAQVALSNSESLPEIRHVPPEYIVSIWWLVAPGVEKTLRFDTEGRTAQDLLDGLLARKEFLTLGFRGDEFIGFSVSWIDRPKGIWHIDLLYSEDNFQYDALSLLEDAARNEGATAIVFGSKRRGFEKLSKQLGFKENYVSYRKEL